MKKSKLLDRFVNGCRHIRNWSDEHRNDMGVVLTAGLVAAGAAFAIKTCQVGVIEPLFGNDSPAVETTVDATAER